MTGLHPFTAPISAPPGGPTDRARGALYGLAIGDALGMPTQLLSRSQIVHLYGDRLEGFEPGPTVNPISAGMAAGSVTDDTDQAVLIARELIRTEGRVEAASLAQALIDWEREMIARGSLDLLGPSTKRALSRFADGEAEGAGRDGDTNGAAMRIAPVGIANVGDDAEALVDRVQQASALTHDTGLAIAGASAVAAAVSAGIAGAGARTALNAGVAAAEIGARRGHWVAGGDVAARIVWAMQLAADRSAPAALSDLRALIGTSVATQESVPAAFGIAALSPDDPWSACRMAASVGGDTDTIAAITGAMLGAIGGASSFPLEARSTIDRVNPELRLDALADQLLTLRGRG